MFKFAFVSAVLLLSTSAFAVEGTSEGTPAGASHADYGSGRLGIPDDIYLNFFTIFHGPGVTNVDKPYTPNIGDGHTVAKDGNQMNFDSEFTAAYLLTNNIGIGPVIPFFLYPVQGKGISLGDVGIKAFNKKMVSTHDLNIYANMIFQIPTSQYSHADFRRMDFALKTTPNIRYSVPNTRYTIGAWTEMKAYFGVNSGKTFKLYGAPYVNYQLTPNFSWNLEFEIEADHMYGTSNGRLTTAETDVMPGFIYIITPKIIVNPYLQIFTGQKISMQNTAVGAVMSASL